MIAAAHIARDVEVVVQSGDHLFALRARVRSATALEGIMIVEAAAAAAADDDAWQVLRQALLSWLPLRLASLLTSRSFRRENTVRVALHLLTVGVPPGKKREHDADAEAADSRAKRDGWDSIIRDYRHLCGGSLDEPWPHFLRQIAGLDELRAREQTSWMTAYAAARSDKPAARTRILARAGFAESIADMTDEQKRRRAQEGWAGLMRRAGAGGEA